MLTFLKKLAENLFPGYFAFVMATGALSIGSFLLDMVWISKTLLYMNTGAYVVLWILTLLRVIYYFPKFKADMMSHTLGPGFFTLVAGTNVYGSQLVVVAGLSSVAIYLWILAIVLWVIIMYNFFTAVTIRKNKPSIAKGINGAWLIAAVATQSLSILGTLLSPSIEGSGVEVLLFFTLCMYFLGCMLYLNIITLIFYRFTFVDFKYDSLSPPYWINMGAVAITTLAGSTLILHANEWALLDEITPFLKGFTLFFWITGTWWIPLLFILMIWKHFYHRDPLKYDPQYWGMVFPLSMYTTSTFQLSQALEVSFLTAIPEFFVYIAITAWIIVFGGLLHHLYGRMRTHFSW
ncbi:C4-dicarboxylate ABC transporter [Virgibacillus sp. MSP4-1]|uniref:tellurite resistance/C4-dicarboxylate transporter family protein n=1 Tax=Virgibacillus sp. MSP4-1 TaxID=2700081 RepID=UPI0003A57515|nr:tellurite resistance/C4-dicarboxylate transporter family protein [Virgibacillus sp. MSP4-1]QHS23731.1 C4-dicarboxylate ABC transporter [Virgibacillus sp. MSP4-1]